MITDKQLNRISSQLQKYGIETADLNEELTDHFSEEIEEAMKEGETFEVAFSRFKNQNSWLKLRKLQHARWKEVETSYQKYILHILRDLWLSPKIVLVFGLAAVIYVLINQEEYIQTAIAGLIKGYILIQTGYIAFRLFSMSRRKNASQFSFPFIAIGFVFYLLVMPNVLGGVEFFYPLFKGPFSKWVNYFYVFLLCNVAYIHLLLFFKAIHSWKINAMNQSELKKGN